MSQQPRRLNDPSKRNEQILLDLLKIEANKYCADCGQKGTRWASWNIGVFLCIRCGGLHRALGTHISKVKSVTLDKWTDEQVESIRNKGNGKVNITYNPHPDKHPFPVFSGDMETYIRDKYERKFFMDADQKRDISDLKAVTKKAETNLLDFDATSPVLSQTSGTLSASAAVSPVIPSTNGSSEGTSFGKQLALLAEMGFEDTEFSMKALRASGGNMQEALEIIVAANKKHRQRSVDRSVLDEIQAFSPPERRKTVEGASFSMEPVKSALDILDSDRASADRERSMPPTHPVLTSANDWDRPEDTHRDTFAEEVGSYAGQFGSGEDLPKQKPRSNSQGALDPWSNPDLTQQSEELSETKTEAKSIDPFTFNPFTSSSTSAAEKYLDNPW